MKGAAKEKVDEVISLNVQTSSTGDLIKQIDVSVQFKHLEASRTTQDSRFTTVRYPISIYLGEAVGSHKGRAVVPFTIEAKTSPEVASFVLKGEAYIQGLPEEIEPWVVPEGEKAPKIWRRIYQEAIAMLTILAKFVDVPPPPAPSSEETEEKTNSS